MKEYDVIAIGSGSSMNIVSAMLGQDEGLRVAVIDKDEPGGICLTRGCIPSKLILYPAELIRALDNAGELGLNIKMGKPDFTKIMARMRKKIDHDINNIRRGLSGDKNIDYYTDVAEFTAPYTLRVGGQLITSKLILLCVGSEIFVPPIENLAEVGYLDSDSFLHLTKMPDSMLIVGGGYIAAEYGHFMAAMGCKVTIIGRNPQFLKNEEPEVSWLARKMMGENMTIVTNHEVLRAERTMTGKKALVAKDRRSGAEKKFAADEILIAAGRASNARLLRPDLGGIEVNSEGWIKVNEHLETSQPGIWAFGDATGEHLFKHVANYESLVVYQNVVLGRPAKVDYHAVPHAVFTVPEIAGVGMLEKEAIAKYGEDHVGIGFYQFKDTAKGDAMEVGEEFVKIIVENRTGEILGASIIGPHASVLIQEIINLMNTDSRTIAPFRRGMHIHPALNEVVDRAASRIMPPGQYRHLLMHMMGVAHGEPGYAGHSHSDH